MVVCGDFLQVRRLSELPLPFPLCLRLIPTFSTFSQLPPVMENNADAVFAFESESWNKVISKSVNLTTVSVPFPLSSSLRDLTSVSFSDLQFPTEGPAVRRYAQRDAVWQSLVVDDADLQSADEGGRLRGWVGAYRLSLSPSFAALFAC